ncbi:hypothetical protein VNO78_23319 [Psophocarpus tetragonolobus]|uniref:Uncharacterized protein n=1 Tax=Psophocarpus tetragonolobus TaxID=3891 RepID=A0AAN9S6I1_PSOTE
MVEEVIFQLRDLGDEKYDEELSEEDGGHSCRDEKESEEAKHGRKITRDPPIQIQFTNNKKNEGKKGYEETTNDGLKRGNQNENFIRSPNFSGIQGLQSKGSDEDSSSHNSGMGPTNGGLR